MVCAGGERGCLARTKVGRQARGGRQARARGECGRGRAPGVANGKLTGYLAEAKEGVAGRAERGSLPARAGRPAVEAREAQAGAPPR